MSNQAQLEITGAAQATVEVVAGSPPVVEVTAPATPVAIEVSVQGPQGPIGLTGIVTAVYPLAYDVNARSLSLTLPPGNSGASTTQFLRGDGTWATPAYDALVDASTVGTLYVGRATLGTAQSTASWTIVKSTFSAAGVRLTKGTATGVAWTGRTSATYT